MTTTGRTAPRRTNNSAIARARLAKGLTQRQLAEAVGTSSQQVANWEQGLRKPKFDALRRMADALDVDALSLIE